MISVKDLSYWASDECHKNTKAMCIELINDTKIRNINCYLNKEKKSKLI